jgi:hypothetical protein
MSELPCDRHGQRARGKLLSFYLTIIRGGERFERRLRLCDDCTADMASEHRDQWDDGFLLRKQGESWACRSCGVVDQEPGTRHPMYVTCWNFRNVRFDYSSLYCDDCADMLIGKFGLAKVDRRAA